jgi:hypothetical protein
LHATPYSSLRRPPCTACCFTSELATFIFTPAFFTSAHEIIFAGTCGLYFNTCEPLKIKRKLYFKTWFVLINERQMKKHRTTAVFHRTTKGNHRLLLSHPRLRAVFSRRLLVVKRLRVLW